MTAPAPTAFDLAVTEGGLPADDVLDQLLPLMRSLVLAHDEGRVGDLEGLLRLSVDADGVWSLNRAPVSPKTVAKEIQRVELVVSSALEVVSRGSMQTEVGIGAVSFDSRSTLAEGGTVGFPVHVPGYRTWEGALGHSDALVDIFVLGLLLASLACGLDLEDAEDHQTFVRSRDHLFRLTPDLNPVLARTIREMTELDRHRRAQDLRSLVRRLETYRDQPDDFDLTEITEHGPGGADRRREVVLKRLRDRLFDPTRRNRLLYFRSTQQTVDLTATSVPQRLDHRRIPAQSLLTWQPAVADALATGKALKLGTYLRFDENPFLSGVLDKIGSQARRDRAEYGFAQLRLVLSFLAWHDLRGAETEVIDSPLLLLPVELVKKKGVRDTYGLEAAATEAEVNPSLRQRLLELYALKLPERVELSYAAVADFHAELTAQIQASEPGVSLRLIEQPRIELIQRQARLRAEMFLRRRASASSRARSTSRAPHSYQPDDYRPLGLQLFLSKIRPDQLPQRVTAGGTDDRFRAPTALAEVGTVTRETYSLRKGTVHDNPYEWEIDLCRLTLGNFNYRRMSLVQDYQRLLRSAPEGSSFDEVFSIEGKALDGEAPVPTTAEQHLVVNSDSTQLKAIGRARVGTSYIIQGPPGTGKSQTITNLIADFLARGQRVLFVCEKRAAVDVVFHRLRQSGLDSLCCLIHDSQADKRAFVMDLKATYESYVASAQKSATPEEDHRDQLVSDVDAELDGLHRLTRALSTEVPGTERTALALLDELLVLSGAVDGDPLDGLDDQQVELLPDLAAWRTAGAAGRRLERALADGGEVPLVSAHPIMNLNGSVLFGDRPQRTAGQLITRARRQLTDLQSRLDRTSLPFDLLDDLTALADFGEVVTEVLLPLQEVGALGLLEPSSTPSRAFDALAAEHRSRLQVATAADAAAVGWRKRPDAETAVLFLEAGRRREGKAMAGMFPRWRKARRLVAEGFTQPEPPLSVTHALTLLVAEREAAADVEALQQQCARDHGTPDLARLDALVTRARALRATAPIELASVLGRPTEAGLATLMGKTLVVAPELEAYATNMRAVLADPASVGGDAEAQLEVLDDLEAQLDLLPTLLDPLRALADADPTAARALRLLPLSSDSIELAAGRRALDVWFAQDRALARLDGSAIEGRVRAVGEMSQELLDANAAVIRARARQLFLDHVRTSSLPAVQLNPAGKAFKKDYVAGRRELEHEFGKVMRYKSIRELAGGAAGPVVADLKPVWLMSPLSVSDTLPLRPDLFDVVIYDEASQIPVEDAVPALHRAPQVVVVGDQMQLPPTSFFSVSDADEDDVVVEEDGEAMTLSLDGASFLNQAARNLSSVLLAWHYRSRSEALIGFSNAAFYGGELRTVPDRVVAASKRGEILGGKATDAKPGAASVLDRPISFHRMEHGVYADRRNGSEAAYIAELVRSLLAQKTGRSIGVIAFSEAQQGAIEDALSRLAGSDATFATQLEQETEREEEDQFVGFFVKNLENVQGDERDIVILSICYGPDPGGRMRMNFGPINSADGEKRLNVIFSRAKYHMAVISSIRHEAITNDWNDGANALKGFLRYAEASSLGEPELVRSVLEGYLPRASRLVTVRTSVVVDQVAVALRRRGLLVETDIGSSQLRCDLAVRRKSDKDHRLAVLVDHRADDGHDDHERYVDRPRSFAACGWDTSHIAARDWLTDPEAVVDRLVARVSGKVVATPAPRRRARPVVAEFAVEPEPTPAPAPKFRAPRAPAKAAPVSAPAAGVRRFELVEGGSSKFWEVRQEGALVHVRFGRIGTAGQQQTKDFSSDDAALRRVNALVREKLGKGYTYV